MVVLIGSMVGALSGCATTGGHAAQTTASGEPLYIENPFSQYAAVAPDSGKSITFRSKKGDKQMEIEIPQDPNAEFQVPMNPKLAESGRDSNTGVGPDDRYLKQKPGMADREIASTFTDHEDPVAGARRREIESGLGLQPSDDRPVMDESYLGKIDFIKQLFNGGRHEAALMEIDSLIKQYPTNARLYEMRGTVLDRIGYPDLALRSWKQALEFEPGKVALRKVVERREAQRNVASQKR
jgi:tetratricopeptide (TPR) repeat protein